MTDSPVESSSNKTSEAYLNALQSKEARDEEPKDDNSLERKRYSMCIHLHTIL